MIQSPISLFLLGGLLALYLMAPVLMASTPASMCTPLKTLNDSLSHRRRYMLQLLIKRHEIWPVSFCAILPTDRQTRAMPHDCLEAGDVTVKTKHNFPINYSIRVYHEEIFKLSNISRMRLKVDGLDDLVLQRLWFQVNQGVLKKIIRVMPERHPSRSYTAEVERRFRDAEGVFVQSHPAEVFQQELPETVQDIWDQLTEESDRVLESNWRFASPKSLVDNLCHTMYCLFSECFSSTEAQQDYCGVPHSKRGKKTSNPKAEMKPVE